MRDTKGRFMRCSVLGFGIYDSELSVLKQGDSYRVWRSMIARCYSEKYQKNQTTYLGCTVCEDWKYFSNFKEWYNGNSVKGWELDKDLLGDGKIYSPATCCFLPKDINLTLPKTNTTSSTIQGVVLRPYGKYTCQVKNEVNKIEHLGTFLTESDAFSAYSSRKAEVIRFKADKYKSELHPRAYEALINIDIAQYIHKIAPTTVGASQ